LLVDTVTVLFWSGRLVMVLVTVTGAPTGAVPAGGPATVCVPAVVGIVSVGTWPGMSPLIVAVTVAVAPVGVMVTVPLIVVPALGVSVAVVVVGQEACASTSDRMSAGPLVACALLPSRATLQSAARATRASQSGRNPGRMVDPLLSAREEAPPRGTGENACQYRNDSR
jgi:hypothetical protein